MKRFATCALVLAVILVSFSSCPQPSGPVTRYLTGTVRDVIDGTLLSGVTVYFGNGTTTTDANGRFSISLGTSGGNITADFSLYKDNYQGYFITNVSTDSSKNTNIFQSLFPYNEFSYPKKNLIGKIYLNGSQIADGTKYEIDITARMPGFGQAGIERLSGTYGGGFSVQTRSKARDCIIIRIVA